MLNAAKPLHQSAVGPPQSAEARAPKARAPSARRAIAALILREMETSFGRSPGGYLWAVAEPLAAIALLSLAFSLAFHAPALGSSFALFYASGYLPYMLWLDASGRVAQALRQARPLLNYPAIGALDALIARFILAVLTHLVVISLVLGGLLALVGVSGHLRLPLLLEGLALAAALAFGTGVLNCALTQLWPLWDRIWQILTRPLFLISAVFFLPERMLAPFDDWLMWNPLIHAAGLVRAGLYAGYDAPGISPAYGFGLALGLAALGLLVLRRAYRRLFED